MSRVEAVSLLQLSDEALLEEVQRQCFSFFWEGADRHSGLAPDRRSIDGGPGEVPITIGGSGFGIMALIVAVERQWITRAEGLQQLQRMLNFLTGAHTYHGVYSHFMNTRSGETVPLFPKDDGGDLVETSFLCMGLLCARQYFDLDNAAEISARTAITQIWERVDWGWYTQGGHPVLYWHWSPNFAWDIAHEVRGWNECLITYVLAVASPTQPVDPELYDLGYAGGRYFRNGASYYGIELPLGVPYGGSLFFAHYSFCGLDPHGLRDRYADYWQQNVAHVNINRAHCIANPLGHRGYGPDCWGLTASDDPTGYMAHAPDNDNGTISPTAALASFPYAPEASMQALRHFLAVYGDRIWNRYGFVDAFCESRGWYAQTFLAIDQGPIVVMIENFRSGLLWKLFMAVPEVRRALRALKFQSPHLQTGA
ncbi:MAG TPA: glucoamylase family protein [Steroidobacteraceae bacterium]|nr:glucoamylase family protein [Steroidobacteraceae bacterium]